jgi:transcriptional regulator with XRE-family HTH domain
MAANPNSSIRSRRVSAELRRYREQAGLTGAQAAEALGISASKISRLENGNRGLQIEDVAAMLGLYRVPERRRDEILELVRKSDDRGLWYSQGPKLPDIWQTLIDFERAAKRIHNFESLVIPGLLQSADYCGATIQGFNETITESELNTLVGARMSRQAILRNKDLQLLAIIDEGVLTRMVGDEGIMRRQLRRLVDEADRPNITLRVVPLDRGAYAGLRGAFMTLDFEHEPSVVHVENQTTGLFLEQTEEIAAYRQVLSNIASKALSAEESIELIASAADRV